MNQKSLLVSILDFAKTFKDNKYSEIHDFRDFKSQ